MNDPFEIQTKLGKLTDRQCKILYWVCRGDDYKRIAGRINFSVDLITKDMSEVYDVLELSELSSEQRRQQLYAVVCPIHSAQVANPDTDCSNRVIEIGEPSKPNEKTLALVKRDDREGVIPINTALSKPFRPEYLYPQPLPRRNIIPWLVASFLGLMFLVTLGALVLVLLNNRSSGNSISQNFSTTTAPSTDQTAIVTLVATKPPIIITATPQPPTTATPSKTFTPPLLGSLLYQADWSSGINGWPGNFGWKVVNGMLVNDGSTSDYKNWIAAPYASIPTPNYAVETEIQLLRNPECGSYGVVLREVYQIGIHICPGQKILAIVRGASGDVTFGSVAYTPPATVWHKFRIEAKGNSYKTLIDGSNILEVSDNTNLTPGRIGLWSDRTQINVRTFKVFAQ